MSNLLKEAIADAKAVKETALKNAKLALEETFQPTLQRMISSKLAEEDDDEGELDFSIDFSDDEPEAPAPEADVDAEPEGGVGMDSFQSEPEAEPAPEEEEDLELEALLRELDGEEEEPVEDEFLPESDDLEGEETLESLLRELEGEEDEEPVMESDEEEYVEENRKLRRENKKLKADVREALGVVTKLKSCINEVNLLNSKLMYATKFMKATKLSEKQQLKVVEALDRARTVREVKLIYSSIHEQFSKSAPRSMKTFASKAMPVAKPKQNIVESNGIKRLQELAGIRKMNG